jgi:UDP-N-acetyl-D-galactosamine dehydrogenase
MKKKNIKINGAKVLVMGLTFKENCPDLRNSGIQNVIAKLKKSKCHVDLQDPWANKKEIKKIYNVYPNLNPAQKSYDAIIVAIGHNEFKKIGFINIKNLCKKNHIIFDLKNLFESNHVDFKL